ncbi:MAG: HNH endonuclease [Actinobacteria bacterium]|nr:HNH endonuclease [Actinomycetota bacterium]
MRKDVVTDEALSEAVAGSNSLAEVIRKLGKKQAGGTQSHYKRRINVLGLDCSHFKGQGWNKAGTSANRKSSEEILILRESGGRSKSTQLRRALIEIGVPYVCSKCGCTDEWLGNPLVLDVDHINENWLDDRRENLRFLCPNCHSQFSRKLLDS